MATQEEINKYVEQLIQERAIEAKIQDIDPIIPVDLEKELTAEEEAAYQKYLNLYKNHSHLTRKQYIQQGTPLIIAWENLKENNEAIKARNALKTKLANATSEEEKKALEEKAVQIKEANAEVFKAIAITATEEVIEKAG